MSASQQARNKKIAQDNERLRAEIEALERARSRQVELIAKMERAMADQEEEIDILQQRMNGLTHALHIATAPQLAKQDRLAP
jgi:SMC interacting uncharacterized protein involved in chromosome segregation